MGMKESWGTGVLAGFLLFIGGFLAVVGIAMLGNGSGAWVLIVAVGILVYASYLKYVSEHSVRVVEQPQAQPTNSFHTHLNHADKLGQLKQMLDKGLITPEEYEVKKAEILKNL